MAKMVPLVLVIVAIAVVLAFARLRWRRVPPLWEVWVPILLCWLGLVVLREWRKARRRLRIEEFSDYTGKSQALALGLNDLLADELTRLRELYDWADRQAASVVAPGSRHVGPAIQVQEDPNQLLEAAVSEDSKVKVGPVAFSLRPLAAFLTRLAQGPRLTGGLYSVDTQLILAARLSGGPQANAWQVEGNIHRREGTGPPEGPSELRESVGTLIARLAEQVHNDLMRSGWTHWNAAHHFNRGLRAYQEAIRTGVNRAINLREAERAFVEANVDDPRFAWAYYDLGLVYQTEAVEQGDPDLLSSARFAFERAIELTPDRAEAYYALATLEAQDPTSNDKVALLCERAIELSDEDGLTSAAYNLWALAQVKMGPASAVHWHRAIVAWEKAVRHGWAALCASERELAARRRSRLDSSAQSTSTVIVNLAAAHRTAAGVFHSRGADLRCSNRLLREALSITPANTAILTEGARVYTALGRLREAQHALRKASRITPGDRQTWAIMARNAAATGMDGSIALRQALTRPTALGPEGRGAIAEALFRLNDADQLQWASDVWTTDRYLSRSGADGPDRASLYAELLELANNSAGTADGLPQALIYIALAEHERAIGDWQEAEDHLRRAIAALEPFPHEIRERGIRGLLARVLVRMGRSEEALEEATTALTADPFSTYERQVLGEVYYDGYRDFPRALKAFEEARLRSPSDPTNYFWIGRCYRELAEYESDVSSKRALLKHAVRVLEQALELRHGHGRLGQGVGHFWLGWTLIDLQDYRPAIPHLRLAIGANYEVCLSHLFLGHALLRQKLYDEARAEFSALLASMERSAASQSRGEAESLSGLLNLSRSHVQALTNCGIAFSYVKKGVSFDLALGHLDVADGALDALAPDTDDVMRIVAEADVRECRGKVLLELGRVDDAIPLFEQAVSLEASAERYLGLAEGLAMRLHLTSGAARLPLVRRVRSACRQVQDLDIADEFANEVRELLSMADAEAVRTDVD